MNQKSQLKYLSKSQAQTISVGKESNSSFFARLFGMESRKVVENLRRENSELIQINQRNMEAIKSISDQLAEALAFQQNFSTEISERLKIVETLPQKNEDLLTKVNDIFERSSFYMQNAGGELIQAKNNVLALQIETLDSLGALEISEFMRSFLTNNLLAKFIRVVVENMTDSTPTKEFEILLQKIQKNLSIVNHHMGQINFKLEKYNCRIEESLFKSFQPEAYTAETTETCDPEAFHQLIKLGHKIGLFEESEKIKSLVIQENLPAVFYFHKEKASWVVKRRGKVVVLKPA